jgi:hypothetical protein
MNESKTLSNITIFINDKKFLSIKEMENGNFYNFLSIDNLIVFCYHNGTDIRSEYYVIVSLNAEIIMSGKEFDFQNLSGMVLNKNSKKGPLYIESNSLFLEGTRITHGPSVIFEGQMKNLSEINLNEIVIATYKFKYLGNSKFDAPFIIESITAIYSSDESSSLTLATKESAISFLS